MKVIDKQLLFINSNERDSGIVSDFHLSLPPHLLSCRPQQRMRMVLNDVVIPYTWYNVQKTNQSFQVVVNGSTHDVQLDLGSYHALQLRDQLNSKLAAHNVTVSFTETSSQYTFTMSNPVGTNALVFGTAGAHHLLGFHNSSTNPFIAGTLQSVKAVSMMFTDALYLHCDLLNSNIDKRAGDGSMFHLSTAFAKLMVNTSPFNNIIFQNVNDDYMLNLLDDRVNQMHFWVTTVEHGKITLNDDFSFTMKVEVFEDDEKTLLQQNSGLGELLRLLVLQNHKDPKLPKNKSNVDT